MKNTVKIYLTALVFATALSSLPAGAQKLDPTVNVSREYKGKLIETEKPASEMAVPDSVTKFNVKYDYSVFKTQYKGAYEFNPYLLDMKPQKDAFSGKKLYARLGAGYALHPEADVVWTPNLPLEGFALNLYGSHRSYYGNYRSVFGRDAFKGLDMTNEAGAYGRKDWNKGFLMFDLSYDGIMADSPLCARKGWNSGNLDVRFASKPVESSTFMYDVALSGSFGGDKWNGNKIRETDLGVDATIGSQYAPGKGIFIDLDAQGAMYGEGMDYGVWSYAVTPKYVFNNARWSIDAGVKLGFLRNPPKEKTYNSVTGSKIIYPAIKVDYLILKDNLDAYCNFGGGNDINSYSSMIHSNHFITPDYALSDTTAYMDNTVERLSARIGLKGNIAKRFTFDICGGYRLFNNAPMYSMAVSESGVLSPALTYIAYSMTYGEFNFGLRTADIEANGGVMYRKTMMDMERGHNCFKPSALTANFDVTYNWNRRVFAGICLEAATKSELVGTGTAAMLSYALPGYVDLGFDAEFRVNSKWAVWLKARNLLNKEIQRNPFYAESGIWCSVGVTFNL